MNDSSVNDLRDNPEDERRTLQPTDADGLTEEDYEAIQEAIDDVEQGDQGMRLEEFDREFRRQHSISDLA